MANIKNYIMTYTLEKIHVLDPRPEQINIVDIAHGLCSANRFAGQLSIPYSVAEHSIYAARLALNETNSRKIALAALLHDASEAYMADVPKPIKQHCPNFLKIEESFMEAIGKRFDLQKEHFKTVYKYDIMAYLAELRDLTRGRSDTSYPEYLPGKYPIMRITGESLYFCFYKFFLRLYR